MVYIILLNWNGWKNTLHCLESVMRSDYRDFRVIVCDNQSTDGSLEKIKAWAEGKQPADLELHEQLKPLVCPGVEKPATYIEYRRIEAEAGGNEKDENIPLVLIRNGANNGFSAGNNVGIRYALKKRADYIWLLNNDTLVNGNTLKELVYRMESEKEIGIAGALIYLASEPTKMQTYGGGTISHCTGRDRFVHSPGPVEYVAGTSFFVKRDVFEQVGLLDEKFFFYWEDVDFSRRAVNAGWKVAVVAGAVVYHKFSASVGGQSLKSDLFKVASLTHYFRKHQKKWRWIFPVIFNISGMLVNRILRTQFSRVKPIIKETFKALKIS
ncbi:MAG TPA: glycosyltransferase family 2 protein [Candidatus Kapabacteria bacterium]|nr:glycosyltransferase family 2 protein [Candidatus Kapabacteria bacterium]